MTHKFTAKEIHFLKTETGDLQVYPPDIFLSDLIHSPTVRFTAFEERLAQVSAADEKFIVAVIRLAPDTPETIRKTAGDVFETCFSAIFKKERGIWETLDPLTFALAFRDYKSEKEGTRLLNLLKDKISDRLNTGLIMGLAFYPFQDFEKTAVLGNAVKALDHAAFFGPGHMVVFDGVSLNISGDRLFALEKFEDAIAEYELGLGIAPKNINLINSLGVAYGIHNKLDKALACFEKASAIKPDDVMVSYNIGLIHRINENEEKAILYLQKAHGINGDIFEVELLLGYLLFKTGQHDRALACLDTAARLNPSSGTPHRIKGELFLDKKDMAAAGEAFNTAVKLTPGDSAALSGYAQTMAIQKKNLAIALSFAQKSVAIDPDNPLFTQRLNHIKKLHDQARAQSQANAIQSA